MFNLLVTIDSEAWNGGQITYEMSRCVREYTDKQITQRLGNLEAAAIEELTSLPAVFAYEKATRKDPKFGRITGIEKHANVQEVQIYYELVTLPRLLTNDELWGMETELDLGKMEANRTHWAVKAVDLEDVLSLAWPAPAGANLRPITGVLGGLSPRVDKRIARIPRIPLSLSAAKSGVLGGRPPRVDVRTHQFEVAFSFPGEYRRVVELVAQETLALLGTHSCFYDSNYVAQLAVPQLDVLLKGIYGQRSKLLVCFIGSDYQRKTWTQIEWAAIREVMAKAREACRIMYIRMDEGAVDGVSSLDGYIDARRFSPAQIAAFIAERVELTGPLAAPGGAIR